METAVAYVLKMYPRFSETFILNELLELERQGVSLHIFSLKQPDDGIFHADVEKLEAPVTYVPEPRVDEPRLKHRLQAAFVASRLRSHGFRHVHAHFASSAASVALHVRRLTGVPYSVTAHAKDIYLNTVRAGDLARKLGSARFTVTVSEFNRRHLAACVARAHVVRIYNGLDLERFAPNGGGREEPPLVLGVGRLVEKKGFEDLLRACARLRAEGAVFQCKIVGKGPSDAKLRKLARRLGLSDTVELAGPLPREALVRLYSHASVLAAPCVVATDGNRDGLPTVLVEAMALGVPVVATDVTGIPELVTHERTGLVVPQRDPAQLAHAIRRTLDNPEQASRRARAGRARVKRDFDLRQNVARLRLLFETAVRS